MTSNALRNIVGAASIVTAAGVGIATNVVTDQPSIAWGAGLALLVTCAISLHLCQSFIERRNSKGGGQVDNSRSDEPSGTPEIRQESWRSGTTMQAGNDVSVGLTSRPLVIIVAILAAISIIPTTLLVLSSRDSNAQPNSEKDTVASRSERSSTPSVAASQTAQSNGSRLSTEASPGVPTPRRSGSQTLARGVGVDLDSDNENWGGGGGPNVNLGISGDQLRPYHGAKMAATSNADLEACRRLPLSNAGVPVSSLVKGQGFCVKTPAGRFALVTIVKPRMENYMVYDIGITVWD